MAKKKKKVAMKSMTARAIYGTGTKSKTISAGTTCTTGHGTWSFGIDKATHTTAGHLEALKINLIRLAKYHKQHCSEKLGEDCDVSLILLLDLAERAGLKLTEEEKIHFF